MAKLICDSEENFSAFIIYGILLNTIGFFGIIGNIISLIILSRPQMKSSINYLLMGLAFCDITVILTSILLFGLPSLFPYCQELFTYYYYIFPHITPVVYPLTTMAQFASVYFIIAVTLERFVAVCFPLKARTVCTYGRAKQCIFVTVVFSFLYNLPRFWEVKIYADENEQLNVTLYCLIASDLRKNEIYKTVYTLWCNLFFKNILPFTSLAVFNALIYRQIRKTNSERRNLSRHQQNEISITVMLLCIVVVFLICNTLPLIVNIFEVFFQTLNDDMVGVSNLLVTINSSVNFIIYVILGEKFNKLFFKIFCSTRFFVKNQTRNFFNHNNNTFYTSSNKTTSTSINNTDNSQKERKKEPPIIIRRNSIKMMLDKEQEFPDFKQCVIVFNGSVASTCLITKETLV